jgi:hypothetical protein
MTHVDYQRGFLNLSNAFFAGGKCTKVIFEDKILIKVDDSFLKTTH